MSFIRNTVDVIRGDKSAEEAIVEVAGDTAKAAGMSYATGFVGSALKGCMQNASSECLRTLSNTSLPTQIVTVVVTTGKTLKKYADGEIDGTECLTELGEDGTGILASAVGGSVGCAAGQAISETVGKVVGQVLIPIPVIGSVVGSMVGYALCTAFYKSVVTLLQDAKATHEERLAIEAQCEVIIESMREYRAKLEDDIAQYLTDYTEVFALAIEEMSCAEEMGDVEGFITGANRITTALNGTPQFTNQEGFDERMKNPAPIKL